MFKRKFTWIDFIIFLVILVSMVGLKGKFTTAKVVSPLDNKSKEILITFFIEETPDYTIDAINLGDPVKESIQNSNFGEIVEITPSDSIYWESDKEGKLISSPREGYSSLYITMKSSGTISGSGVSIDKSVYYVGQTVSLYAGNSIFKDGRISKIIQSK